MAGRWIVSLGLACSLWLGVSVGFAQPAPTDREAERTALYEEGVSLAEAGRWADAVERFRRVLAIRSAPRARYTLGEAEEKSGRLASAKASYARALEEARGAGDAEAAGAAGAALAALERRVPRLVLRLPEGVAGAEIRVDGQAVELSDQGLELDPGEHRVVVEAPGRRAFDQLVAASEGRTTELRVQLAPAQGAVASGTAESGAGGAGPNVGASGDRGASNETSGPPTGAWVLGAAGLAATAAGAALYLTGQSAYEEAEALCPAGACAEPGHADDGNAARGQMVAGDVVMGVGIGAVAGAALWWALSAGPAAPEPEPALAGIGLGFGASHDGLTLTLGGSL